MPVPPGCPEMECLEGLFDDAAPAEVRERWERHLESCPECQERLRRGGEGGARWRELGRRFGDPTAAPADPTLAEVLRRLHGTRCAGRPAGDEPVDLYFLRPAARSGLLGVLGEYEVLGVIGRGGMGVVLKAYEPALTRVVALKVLAPELAGSATARRRFTREARAAAAVCHEHVVAVHAVGEVDSLPYLVMQYVPGESLQARLDRSGPLEVAEVVRIGMQTAQGLAAAHARGLIHRDLKPANVLLSSACGLAGAAAGTAKPQAAEGAVPKLTDFGLARPAEDVGLTQPGVVVGTPEYMPPEQARGGPVDHRSDLYSLGAVLYAMCAGRPPFRGDTPLAVLRRVCDEEPERLRSTNPEVPAWLEALIARLMAKDPDRRFQGAAEVATLLEGFLAHLRRPTAAPAPALPSSPAALPAPRPLRPPAMLFLAVLAAGLAGWFAGAGGEPNAKREYPQEYYHRFKGAPDSSAGLELYGPDADQYVHFEPEGLHLVLPAGSSRGDDRGTGVMTTFGVRGDFEITAGFEILQEPEPALSGKRQTRVTLAALLDHPKPDMATFSRRVERGGRHFLAWYTLSDEQAGKPRSRAKGFPTSAKAGRLRLVRAGAMLSYHAAEGLEGEFTRLIEYPFSADDLRDVRVGAVTGDPRAALDVRVTDLCIRAESLLNLPAPAGPAAGGGPANAERKGWLGAVLVLGLASACGLALGAWLYLRQRRRPGGVPAGETEDQQPPQQPAPVVPVRCPGCGKNLKAKAALAGKEVRCPQCGEAVVIPRPGEA